MSAHIARAYWKFSVDGYVGVANEFYADKDWDLWIDPLMIQVERAFALKQARADCEPVLISGEHIFCRLEWLKTMSGRYVAKRLQIKLEKVTLRRPGHLVRIFDQVIGVLGNADEKY